MLRQDQSRTGWARVDAQSEKDLAPAIDRAGEGEFDWSTAQIGIPRLPGRAEARHPKVAVLVMPALQPVKLPNPG